MPWDCKNCNEHIAEDSIRKCPGCKQIAEVLLGWFLKELASTKDGFVDLNAKIIQRQK